MVAVTEPQGYWLVRMPGNSMPTGHNPSLSSMRLVAPGDPDYDAQTAARLSAKFGQIRSDDPDWTGL